MVQSLVDLTILRKLIFGLYRFDVKVVCPQIFLDNELCDNTRYCKSPSSVSIRRLKKVGRILKPDISARLVSEYIISIIHQTCLVYRNLQLQRVHNNAARLAKQLTLHDTSQLPSMTYSGCRRSSG